MSKNDELTRRAFLKKAGLTALVVVSGGEFPLNTAIAEAQTGQYDFDTPTSSDSSERTCQWSE
jgi:hypothetical protein